MTSNSCCPDQRIESPHTELACQRFDGSHSARGEYLRQQSPMQVVLRWVLEEDHTRWYFQPLLMTSMTVPRPDR